VQRGEFAAASHWLAETENVLRYGPLPVLAARQVAVRLVAVTTASVSFVLTLAQALF
jgi:hypothetical protein